MSLINTRSHLMPTMSIFFILTSFEVISDVIFSQFWLKTPKVTIILTINDQTTTVIGSIASLIKSIGHLMPTMFFWFWHLLTSFSTSILVNFDWKRLKSPLFGLKMTTIPLFIGYFCKFDWFYWSHNFTMFF